MGMLTEVSWHAFGMTVLLAGSECTISSFVMPRFPEPISSFLFLRTEGAGNTSLVLLNDKVQGVKPLTADNLMVSALC